MPGRCVCSLAIGSLLKVWPSHIHWLQGTWKCAGKGGVPRRFVYAAAAKLGQGSATYGMLKTGQMDRYCLKPNPRTATYYRLNPGAPPVVHGRRMTVLLCSHVLLSCRARSLAHAWPCDGHSGLQRGMCSHVWVLALARARVSCASPEQASAGVTNAAGRAQTAARTARWICLRRRRRPRRRC